jgi:hypothetical protein
MKLGKNQLHRLLGLASPGMMLVVGGDRVSNSLVKRGLIGPRTDDPNAFLGITPNGMRALADAFEAGELQQFMKPFPPKPPEIPDPEYDSAKDVEGCFHDAYAAVRDRVANGGPGWTPK